MSLNPNEVIRKKLSEATQGKKEKDERADAIIWAAVAINAGMGAVPFGINAWTFVGVNTVMVTCIAATYGHHLTNEGAGKVIRHIFTSVGLTFMMFTLGMKFFAEVLKGAGVITMGGATVAGMALDATLCGGVTYALGFTSKDYFKKDQKLSSQEIEALFKQRLAEGKAKMAAQQKQRV